MVQSTNMSRLSRCFPALQLPELTQKEKDVLYEKHIPAPFIKARYPPPEAAIPIFGSAVALFLIPLIYDEASKPVIFILVNHEIIGSTVAFLLNCSHAVSFGESESASLIVGRFAGQGTTAGAYPPDGEFGNARLMAANGAAMASTA